MNRKILFFPFLLWKEKIKSDVINETIESGLQSLKKGVFEEIKEEEENYTSSMEEKSGNYDRLASKINSK